MCARRKKCVDYCTLLQDLRLHLVSPPFFPSQHEISEKYKREFLVQNAPELPPLGFNSLRKIPFPLSLKKSHQERTSKC